MVQLKAIECVWISVSLCHLCVREDLKLLRFLSRSDKSQLERCKLELDWIQSGTENLTNHLKAVAAMGKAKDGTHNK